MATRILVTGASGFLGSHLLEQLDPNRVRVLSRAPTDALQRSGAEIVKGDLLDGAALDRALEGVGQVYHLAGLVSRNPEHAPALYRVHVDGTRLLCEAACRAKVERIVLASSSGTIAVGDDPNRIYDEQDEYAIEQVRRWPYYLSKIYQDQVALRFFHDQKLDVVLVGPSLLLGPGDANLSSTQDVLKFLSRSIPAIPPGGLSFVDVRDAASGLVMGMQRGKSGERYFLGGPNWTFAEFFGRLERLSKVMGPKLKLPRRAALAGAWLVENMARWQGRKPSVDAVSIEMAHCFWYLDSSKAERQLGWSTREPAETLLDTIKDLRRRMHAEGAFVS